MDLILGGSFLRRDFLDGVQVTGSSYGFFMDVVLTVGVGDFNGDGWTDLVLEGMGLLQVMVSVGEIDYGVPGYIGNGAGAFRLFP